MEIAPLIDELRANEAVFASLLRRVPEDQRTWRPAPDKWSMLEVVCHLYDEERDDFRARLRSVLDDPTQPLPPTNPEAWVSDRHYADQEYDTMLDAFLTEREASVRWLEGLVDPRWENAYQHPRVGPLTARMFLTTWVAHDYLHVRQIIRMKYQHLEATSGVSLEYAGGW